MKVLVATGNPGKFQHFQELLEPAGIEVVSLKEIEVEPLPAEDGKTFEENARLKAVWFAKQTGLPTLADDGGLEIDALNGEPGVKSHRWPGYEAADQELIDLALSKLTDVPEGKRGAILRSVVWFTLPNEHSAHSTHGNRGVIATAACQTRNPGLPYRSIFLFPEIGKYYAELSHEEHEALDHRKKSVRDLLPQMKQLLEEFYA